MFRDEIRKRAMIGTWIQIPSPDICEMAGRAGVDWIGVDMEHTGISYENLSDMFRALKGTETAAFVRVRTNDKLEIRRALDLGAAGVIVPLVESAGETRKAVEAAMYPPLGKRGFAFCRANSWGRDFASYVEKANDEAMVFVMVESRKAVENIDEILDAERLDGVFIGPYDMSGSYGVVGNTSHHLVEDACSRVLEACKRKDRIAGKHIVFPEKKIVNNDIEAGFKMLAVGIDALFIQKGFGEIADIGREKQ